MSAGNITEALLRSIASAPDRPKDAYVINDEPVGRETELVIDLRSSPAVTYIFERGKVRRKNQFSNPADAALFFYSKLFRIPNFRRQYVSLGGEFEASNSDAKYFDAFRTVARHEGVPNDIYSLPDQERHGILLTIGSNGSAWEVLGNMRSGEWTATFQTLVDALDFAHWKIKSEVDN